MHPQSINRSKQYSVTKKFCSILALYCYNYCKYALWIIDYQPACKFAICICSQFSQMQGLANTNVVIAFDKLYDMAGRQLHSIKSSLDRLSDLKIYYYSVYLIVLCSLYCSCMQSIDNVFLLTIKSSFTNIIGVISFYQLHLLYVSIK